MLTTTYDDYEEHNDNITTTLQTFPETKRRNYNTNPVNLMPAGPTCSILVARDSPSLRGRGAGILSLLIILQVILVGWQTLHGGTTTLTPECRHPLMAPPLASTMKLTRNLEPGEG